MYVDTESDKPIKIWARDLEEGALEQARNVANLPFIYKHIAIMPDGHQGYGMPIGGVMATTGVVVPNAVGVDIGCGMCAVKTSVEHLDTAARKRIMSRIRETVPVGFKHREDTTMKECMPRVEADMPIVTKEFQKAIHQLGTLGGGNHFIELQQGNDGFVWVMIHSGSRNLGYKVAKHYNDVAKTLNTRWHSTVPLKWDLAFLPLTTPEAAEYLLEMNYCVEFAFENRKIMMNQVMSALQEVNKTHFEEIINIAHNYAALEHHGNANVMVHRKGATRARDGEVGIIPGSQGTASYIVEGLGNPVSFKSCSHGAGRRMGRKEATRRLDLAEEQKRLDDLGVVHSVRVANDLDEAPGAYKDIEDVMELQADLVTPIVKLTPLAVVKG